MKKQPLKYFLGFCLILCGLSVIFSGFLLISERIQPKTAGIAFIDANGNGKKDATERGISQETFVLAGKNGKKHTITTTLSGNFLAKGLIDGIYEVAKNNSSQKIQDLTVTKGKPLSIALGPASPSFQLTSNTDFEDLCSSFNGNPSLCNQQDSCYNRWGVGCVEITSGGGIGDACGNGYGSYCARTETCRNGACVPNSHIPCNGRCSSTETCQTHEGVELCVPNTFSRAAPDPICNQNGDSCCFNGTDYYCQGPNNVCNLQNHRCSIIVNDLITNDDSLDKVREISANGRDDYGDYYITNSLITCRDPRVISYRETISFPANQTASIRIRKMCNYHNQSGSCVTGRDDQGNYARCDYGNSPPITCDAEGSACCTNSSGQKYCTGQNMNCKKINSQPICSKIVNPVIDSDLSGQLSIKEGDKFYFAPDFIFNSEAFATVSNVRCENNEVRLHFTLDDEVAQQPKVETEGIFYCNYNNQYGRCVEGVQNGVKFAKCDYNNLPAATCSDTTPYRCPNNTCAANQAACNATPPLVLPGGTTPPAVNTPPTVNTPTPDPNRGCNQGFSRARNNDAICCPNDFPFNIPGSENGGLGVCVETNPNPSQPINTPDTGSSDQPSQNGESCGNATCTPDRYCRRDIQGLEFCALKDISTASGEKCGSRTCDGNFEVCFSYKSCNSASLAADSSAFCVGKNGTEGSACCGNTVGDCAANLECTKNTKAGTDSVGICCPKGSKLVNNVCVSSSSPNSDDTLATPNCGNQTCTNSQSCYQPPAQVPSCIESHSLGVGFYCNAPDQCQSNVCTNNWCQYVPEDVTPPNNESDNSSNPWMNIINNLIGDQTPEDARQNNPINDTTEITACSGDALPYFSGSCETPCMCTDGTECNPQSGGPADFARDYCSTDPNNQF